MSSSCSSESGGTSESENIMVVDESSDDDDDFMVAMVALDWMASGNLHKKTIDNSSIPIMTGLQWVGLDLFMTLVYYWIRCSHTRINFHILLMVRTSCGAIYFLINNSSLLSKMT